MKCRVWRNEIYCALGPIIRYSLVCAVLHRFTDPRANIAARQLGRANSPAKRRVIYDGNIAGGKTREMQFY